MTKNLFKEWIHLLLEIRIPLERCFLQVPWNSIFHRIYGNCIFHQPKLLFSMKFVNHKLYCRLIFWILHFPQHSMEFSFPHNLFMEKCTFHQIWITWSLWKKLYYRGILGEDSLLYTTIEWNFILDKDSLQILENLKMGNLYFTLILSLPYRQKL